MNITQEQAANMIRNSGGKLFSVTFTKRSDRRKMPSGVNLPRRKMVARRGVTQGVTGEGQKFDPTAHGLLVVNEFVTQPDTTRAANGHFIGGGNMTTQFRNIPIEGIEALRINGKDFQVS